MKLYGKDSIHDKISRLNLTLVSIIFSLAFIGFIMLYSAAGGSVAPWLYKQVVFFLLFLPVMFAIAIIDIRFWYKMSYLIYLGGVALLILVELKGNTHMGATRWIRFAGVNLQPSELMKVCLIIGYAKYFHSLEVGRERNILYLIIPAVMLAVPAFLIFRQPDLGTALILIMIASTLIFASGIDMRIVTGGVLAFLATIPFAWKFFLHDYQKQRVITFLNPGSDPLGKGYNIIQSKIAIGSGGITGKGFLSGTQGQLEFLPERQTDFIFTMLSEEFGFIGSLIVILLFTSIFTIGVFTIMRCKHHYGRVLVLGIISMLFYHAFINMAMVMGMLPVVGAPLPLISYGGTITAVTMIAFGFFLNVDIHKTKEIRVD